MTPAQEAKEYAELHGYKIVPNGRRYDVFTDYEGDDVQNHVANVGSYLVALNAMKRHDDELIAEAEPPVLIDSNAPHGNPHSSLVTMKAYREMNEALNQKPPRLYPIVEAVEPTKYEITIKVYPIARGLQIARTNTWTLVIDGLCVARGFATRADALKRLRRLYNSIIGSYYRNAKCIIIREV